MPPVPNQRQRERINPVYQRPYQDADNDALKREEAQEMARLISDGRRKQLVHESRFDIIGLKDRITGGKGRAKADDTDD